MARKKKEAVYLTMNRRRYSKLATTTEEAYDLLGDDATDEEVARATRNELREEGETIAFSERVSKILVGLGVAEPATKDAIEKVQAEKSKAAEEEAAKKAAEEEEAAKKAAARAGKK